jgi:NADPH2:quinone reductase
MKAMVIEEFGGADVFRAKLIPAPELIPGHVLIGVRATSVNAVDLLIRQMGPAFLAPRFPAILHSDVAGVVVDVADDVVDFKPGDEVYGCAGGVIGMGGALAEYMLADASLIAHKPRRLSMAEAASLPLVSITAWEALFERAPVKPGSSVLIHGGAGGVGHIGIQLAKNAGARVYATVSSDEKGKIARDLGVLEAINYREMSPREYVDRYTEGQGFDIVFDTIGNENLARSFEAAKLNGNVVTTVALGSYDLTLAHLRGLSLHVVFMLIPLLHGVSRSHHGMVLREIARLVDEGKLFPRVDPRIFNFEDVSSAHAHMESGEHVGKIVLTRE